MKWYWIGVAIYAIIGTYMVIKMWVERRETTEKSPGITTFLTLFFGPAIFILVGICWPVLGKKVKNRNFDGREGDVNGTKNDENE